MIAFLLFLDPPRPDFAMTMTDEERAVMVAHVGYWSRLAQQGSVIAFGPVADPAGGYGVGIAVAEDVAGVEAMCDADPAMRSGRGFRTRILPMPKLVTATASYG